MVVVVHRRRIGDEEKIEFAALGDLSALATTGQLQLLAAAPS